MAGSNRNTKKLITKNAKDIWRKKDHSKPIPFKHQRYNCITITHISRIYRYSSNISSHRIIRVMLTSYLSLEQLAHCLLIRHRRIHGIHTNDFFVVFFYRFVSPLLMAMLAALWNKFNNYFWESYLLYIFISDYVIFLICLIKNI